MTLTTDSHGFFSRKNVQKKSVGRGDFEQKGMMGYFRRLFACERKAVAAVALARSGVPREDYQNTKRMRGGRRKFAHAFERTLYAANPAAFHRILQPLRNLFR
jgi:hypothetical protein